jgi:ABC-2 type transport system permease protein
MIARRVRARRARRQTAERPAAPARVPQSMFGLVLHQARYDLRSFLRNRQARFFTFVLPIIFLVIFVGVFGNHRVGPEQVKASTYYVPGISALAIIAVSFVNLVITITAQRGTGVPKRRRATPVPAWVLITGRTLSTVTVALLVMAALLAFGRIAYDVRLPTSTIPGVLVTGLVGSITFCILAYALSTAIESADAAQPVVQAIVLPLYFISGIFVPNPNLPSWLQNVARFFPVYHLADGLHHAYDPSVHGSSGIVLSDLAVLGLWALAGLLVALRRFSWLPAAATS